MNELKVFTNEKLGSVRTMEINGEPYFLGKDVAEILGYSNTNKAIQMHVDDEDKKILDFKGFSQFRAELWGENDFSNKIMINESGLYSLIFGSELPSAKEFKHWVTHEVLPSIRMTGGYNAKQSDELKAKKLEIMMINAQARLLKEQNKRVELMMKYNIKPEEPETKVEEPIEKVYTAAEVGERLGVSANKIGRIANRYDVKQPEYGEWFKDVTKTGKEVASFRYNEKGIEVLESYLNGETDSKEETT